jgi:TldD protein
MTLNIPAPSLLDAAGVDSDCARAILSEAIAGADDGELFLEHSESEAFVFDDGRLKSASYDSGEGFGLRVVAGETAGYAHASEISEAALGRAAQSARLAKRGYSGIAAEGPRSTNIRLYGEENPVSAPGFSEKVALLQGIEPTKDRRMVEGQHIAGASQRPGFGDRLDQAEFIPGYVLHEGLYCSSRSDRTRGCA